MSENSGKKCISVNLPNDLLDRITGYKEKTGKSQNSVLTELIEKGLGVYHSDNTKDNMFFFVKVRIDASKMMEFGQKLQSGELDTSHTIMTYCINDDPTVGLSFWQAEDRKSFDEIFSHHRKYYKEVIEIIPVITPTKAMKLIIKKMQEGEILV